MYDDQVRVSDFDGWSENIDRLEAEVERLKEENLGLKEQLAECRDNRGDTDSEFH